MQIVRKYGRLFFALLFLCLFLLPVESWAFKGHSFALKGGYNFFHSDSGWDDTYLLGTDASHFNGFNVSAEWNVFFHRAFSFRVSLERFSQQETVETSTTINGYTYYEDYYRSLTIVPLTFSARFTVPVPFFKPYVYGGFGIFLWSIDDHGHDGSSDFSDSTDGIRHGESPGVLAGGGFEVAFFPHLYFNLEFENRYFSMPYSREGVNYDVNGSAFLVRFGVVFHLGGLF